MDRIDRITAGPAPEDASAFVTARAAFSAWLRAEREARGIDLNEVARVTKIQIRALERLEEAKFDELPADVFVRGFIRNYARVVGLDAHAALVRYDDCGVTPGPAASARARAMVETVSEMAPNAARGVQSVQPVSLRKAPTGPVVLRPADLIAASVPVPDEMAAGSMRLDAAAAIAVAAADAVDAVAVAEPVAVAAEPEPVVAAVAVVEPTPEPESKKKKRRSGGKRRKGKGESPVAVEAAPVEVVVDQVSEGMEITILVEDPIVDPMPEIEDVVAAEDLLAAAPPIEVSAVSSPRIVLVTPPRGTVLASKAPAPTLVIDDADPDSAEREQEARSHAKGEGKRSFLPSSLTRALLDNEKGTRGGLTLAVIILLIVATLTLSYLMRRPSSSGEGVTSRDRGAASETIA